MEEQHNLIIENQKRLSASSVAEVNGFSDKEILLTLVGGKRVTVFGQGLKIANFQKQSGAFVAEGEISKVVYQAKSSASFFKRLVK